MFSLRYWWAEMRFKYGWSVSTRDRAASDICKMIGRKWGGS